MNPEYPDYTYDHPSYPPPAMTASSPASSSATERFLIQNAPLIAATSVATAAFLWLVIRNANLPGSRLLPGLPRPWSVKRAVSGLASTVAYVPRRAMWMLSSASTTIFSSPRQGGPPGLYNAHVSCFENSVSQGLASISSFRSFLHSSTASLPIPPDSTISTLARFLQALCDQSNTIASLFVPREVTSLNNSIEQDAQEFLNKLLEKIEDDLKEAIKIQQGEGEGEKRPEDDGPSPDLDMDLPFEGLTAELTQCTTCGYSDGLRLVPFRVLTVAFDHGYSRIENFLDYYTKAEEIEGVDCNKCTAVHYLGLLKEKSIEVAESSHTQKEVLLQSFQNRIEKLEACIATGDFSDAALEAAQVSRTKKETRHKSKQVAIAHPPDSFLLHLNRSTFDPRTGHIRKDRRAVHFPLELDVSPWMLGEVPRQLLNIAEDILEEPYVKRYLARTGGGTGGKQPARPGPGSVLPLSASQTTGESGAVPVEPPECGWTYQLRAVVAHVGAHHSGHYYCYRHLPPTSSSVLRAALGPGRAAATAGSPAGRRAPGTGPEWWFTSDLKVRPADEATVLGAGEAFMLFYEKVPQQPAEMDAAETGTVGPGLAREILDEDLGESPTRARDPHAPTEEGAREKEGEGESRSVGRAKPVKKRAGQRRVNTA